MFRNKSFQWVFVALILLVAFVLRFWQLGNKMRFIGDFGWYYLSARDFLLTGDIPLVGIPSSVPILKQGAIFTWLLAGFLKIFSFDPVAGAYLTGFLGILGVLGTYKVTSDWFGERTGIVASTIAAVSPFIVEIDRLPFVVGPMFLLTLLIAWSFTQIYKGRVKHYFFLGLWLSFLYQFELAGFIMLPILIVSILWAKVKVKPNEFLYFFIGGLIGLIPFIVHDFKEGFYLQTLGFLGWFGTKIYEGIFSLFIGGRSASLFAPFLSFLARFIFPSSISLAFTAFAFSFFYLIAKYKSSKKYYFEIKFVLVWLILTILGFFVRGIFSEAYMPIAFLPIVTMLSLFFDFLYVKLGRAGYLIFLIVIIGNSWFLYKNVFLSQPRDYITLSQRKEVARFIVEDAKGVPFNLVFRGKGYQFQSGDNHWRYLLWYLGNEPEEKADVVYGIFETPYNPYEDFDVIYERGNIRVGLKK